MTFRRGMKAAITRYKAFNVGVRGWGGISQLGELQRIIMHASEMSLLANLLIRRLEVSSRPASLCRSPSWLVLLGLD